MATDFFLKLDGIPGESTQSNHTAEIDLLSLQFGASSPGQIGSGGLGLSAGKASFSEISFTKNVDKSSPMLFQACGNGSHIKSALFTAQKSTGKGGSMVYFKCDLNDIIVTSYSAAGSGDSLMDESVSFMFSKIVFEYTEQAKDGAAGPKTKAGFDVTTNKSI